MDLGLRGVHVLITGASGGIGMETAKLFIAHGANVTLHCKSNIDPLKNLMEKHGKNRVHCVMTDLYNEDAVQRIFRFSEVQFGPVQVLIVNHAISSKGDVSLVDMTLDQWNGTLQTNLSSAFLVCREYLRGLQEPKVTPELKEQVSIVLIGSTAGKYGEAGNADYAASKSAMMYGLTMTLKNEIVKIAPKGRVNCVAPGWVDTPMAADALQNPKVMYQALATTPLKKIATPRDIANQIAILTSSAVSGHVTGQVVMVEGGMEGRAINTPEEIEALKL
ncbi:hypothetical protein PILCRDRAFT_812662, partial [Piloderma croceum F 1598]